MLAWTLKEDPIPESVGYPKCFWVSMIRHIVSEPRQGATIVPRRVLFFVDAYGSYYLR